MRKYILLLLLAIGVLPGFSQKFYRYVDNEKDILTISGDKFFVSLKDSTYAENLSRVNFISKLDRIDNKGTYLISSTRKIDFSEVFEHLKNDSYVEFLSPVISSNGKEMGGYTSKIIIKTKNEMSLEDIENIVDKYGLRVFEYSKFDKTTVFLQSKEKDASKNQEIANALHSSGIFEYADPNYLLFVNPASDPLYSSQWHLNNTGQVGGTTGEDIKAPGDGL
ncbi:hypothetical protein [Leadbetterella byssophila]|uniref:hypothetical protein n=1 Tax=Leadbetterella byssophila TaxID=316068 RepID=UPI0039A2D33E